MLGSVYIGLAPFASLIVNAVQFVSTAFSTFYLGTRLKKRLMYLSSGILMAASAYLVGIGYVVSIEWMVLIFMIIFIFIYGLLFAPVNWSYPAEILPPSKVVLAITVSWIGLAVVTIFPPIIMEKMDQNAYPIFFFFGVYISISLIYIGAKLVESKGRTYKQVIEDY